MFFLPFAGREIDLRHHLSQMKFLCTLAFNPYFPTIGEINLTYLPGIRERIFSGIYKASVG